MCDFQDHGVLGPLKEDEYVLDTDRVREFVASVRDRIDSADSPGHACERIGPLFAGLRQRPLEPGDFYTLLPPRDDIHRVRTTSQETSVSIHLLANDTGCVWRHTYDEQTGAASPFRSGYVNAERVDSARLAVQPPGAQ